MTDSRTNYGKQIDTLIRQAYGSKIKVFDQTIPRSVRAAETSAAGKSIFQHDPKGKVAEAYQSLAREVLVDAEKRLKRSSEGLDDLFSSEETRQEEQREQVQQIPVDELFPFKNHPFKVLDDDAMTRTVESYFTIRCAGSAHRPPQTRGGYEIILRAIVGNHAAETCRHRGHRGPVICAQHGG